MWALHTPHPLQAYLYPPCNIHIPSLSRKPSNSFLPRCSVPPFAAVASTRATSATELNQLVKSLSKQGHLKKAIEILHRPDSNPTQRTYELLILCCAQKNSLCDAQAVHRHLIDNGFDQDSFLATKLIDMYAELGYVDHARQVFDKIRDRTIFVWNAILRALALGDSGLEALRVYREMNTSGVESDRFTYTFVLKACVVSESSGVLLSGKEIHGRILRHGFEVNVHIMTTLLDFYARFGLTSYASSVFEKMDSKNVVSWSAMIACLAKNGKPLQAIDLFHQMMLESRDFSPNSVTMVSVLQACAALAALLHGKLLHAYILRRSLDSILPVKSALMMMYARCGDIRSAESVFEKMDKTDTISWNSLISSYGMHGFGTKALEVFEEMIARGMKPSPITFVSVLGACSHVGLVEKGKHLFHSMGKVHGIFPSVEHYASMVDIFGRANLLNEAAKFIEDMRLEPGPTVWGSLLGSCRTHCNVELAERACSRLFELEPKNAGNYVLLADIYAEAKMWDKVKRVKSFLEARKLQKVAGCSWIEVRRKIYSFMSVEELNPQIEQVHALLVSLSKEMKEQGYAPKTRLVHYDLDEEEKENILLGHSEKLALGFGLINTRKGETIRITKNLRLCEDCHSVNKFISKFANRDILVRDVNRVHHFYDGVCSCGDYWLVDARGFRLFSLVHLTAERSGTNHFLLWQQPPSPWMNQIPPLDVNVARVERREDPD